MSSLPPSPGRGAQWATIFPGDNRHRLKGKHHQRQ